MPTLKLYYDGWLSLPAGLRQKLGLNNGDRLEAELVDGALVLRPSANARRAAQHEEEAAGSPADTAAMVTSTADAVPAKRGPGRPRKVDRAGEVAPAAGPKRARGRPRKTTLAPASAPETVPAISSEPGKLRKKADLQPAALAEQQASPPRRPERPRSDAGSYVAERRPFRHVEVKKLGPGRGHNKRRLPAELARQSS
jgi:antitoxin component of MazEF toxin-antitoxin module